MTFENNYGILTFYRLFFFFILKQLDILPEQINYQLHDTDFQESAYCQYSTVQFPTALQSQSLQSHFNTYSLDPQFGGGECVFGSYELNKPTYVVDHDAEDGYSGIKRSRLTHSSIRIKRQEELCVVCGDKASGYHYNALTCEGCKGKEKVKIKLKVLVFTEESWKFRRVRILLFFRV